VTWYTRTLPPAREHDDAKEPWSWLKKGYQPGPVREVCRRPQPTCAQCRSTHLCDFTIANADPSPDLNSRYIQHVRSPRTFCSGPHRHLDDHSGRQAVHRLRVSNESIPYFDSP
jgi:hypothetical protein